MVYLNGLVFYGVVNHDIMMPSWPSHDRRIAIRVMMPTSAVDLGVRPNSWAQLASPRAQAPVQRLALMMVDLTITPLYNTIIMIISTNGMIMKIVGN